jgi:tetrahydromethanopterin S-methyltransferase subunit A
MTATSSLHQLALEAVTRSDLDDFPALKQSLREAVDEEQKAAERHKYNIKAAKGGTDEFTIYFDVEADPHDPESWVVAEGLQAFYKGVEITDLFDGSDLDEDIYIQSNEVEQQMADAWAEDKIAEYEAHRDD